MISSDYIKTFFGLTFAAFLFPLTMYGIAMNVNYISNISSLNIVLKFVMFKICNVINPQSLMFNCLFIRARSHFTTTHTYQSGTTKVLYVIPKIFVRTKFITCSFSQRNIYEFATIFSVCVCSFI